MSEQGAAAERPAIEIAAARQYGAAACPSGQTAGALSAHAADDCYNQPTELAQSGTMEQLKEVPVHVHCIANYRVSAFLYRYRREVLGTNEAQARADMEDVWQNGEAMPVPRQIDIAGTNVGEGEQLVDWNTGSRFTFGLCWTARASGHSVSYLPATMVPSPSPPAPYHLSGSECSRPRPRSK
jgi:hypothetical protein